MKQVGWIAEPFLLSLPALQLLRRVFESQFPSVTASALSSFSSTPLVLLPGSGVKGGPTVFVGSFIARPLTPAPGSRATDVRGTAKENEIHEKLLTTPPTL